MQEFNKVTNSSPECLGKLNILPRLEVDMSGTHQNFKILGTAGYYRVPRKFQFMTTPGAIVDRKLAMTYDMRNLSSVSRLVKNFKNYDYNQNFDISTFHEVSFFNSLSRKVRAGF